MKARERKYTPGPWTIMNKGASWLIYGPLGERICKMLYPDRAAIREANAQLIAAAPCMLKELEKRCAACNRMNAHELVDCEKCSMGIVIAQAHGVKS